MKHTLWYSLDDLNREAKKLKNLSKLLSFYTEEELFDRFGVEPKKVCKERIERIRENQQYVGLLVKEGCLWKMEKRNSLNTKPQKFKRSKKSKAEAVSRRYSSFSKECAQIAQERAAKMADQVAKQR